MRKFMFRVTERREKGDRVTIHEYFAESQEGAQRRALDRFGPEAEIEFLKETT